MKLTKKILAGLLLLLACSILLSAFEFKKIYDQNDKGELYFLYSPIQEQPFSHLVVNGGNISNIIFEPAAKPSVRVFKRWNGYKEKRIKTIVRNDTLYLDFPDTYNDMYEKMQLKNTAIVRIFAPQLKSITGFNTKIQVNKFKQNDLAINISGKSVLEVESLINNLNKVSLKASDTTEIIIEMSPLLMKSHSPNNAITKNEIPEIVKGWDVLHINSLDAVISGSSLIDVGHAQIDSINTNVSDSSAIILSGGTLGKNYQKKR
jgi:hypothetical protein